MDVAVDIPEDEEKRTLDSKPEVEALTLEETNGNRSRYWDDFYQAMQSTSIRGLSRALTKKKKKYKFYWITVFLVALTIFCINLRKITERFISSPILTQLERQDKPFTWPHFTLCSPANPIPFWTDPKLIPKWKTVLKKAESDYSLPKYDLTRQKKIWEHYMGISTINPSQFYKQSIKGSVFKMLVFYEDTSIVGYSSALDLFNNVKDFEKVFDVRLYTIRSPIACITLVTDRLKEVVKELQSKAHRLIGIKLYLIMDVKSYMTFDMGYESRKMYFYLTKPNSTILSVSPFYIPPGTDNSFRLKQKIQSRVAHCTKKTFKFELYDINMVTTWPFEGGFDDCRSFLSQKKFVSQCGCYNPYLPVYKLPGRQPNFCTNMTLFDNAAMSKNIDCLNTVLKDNFHSDAFQKEVNKSCAVYQMNPCVESSYSVSSFTTAWQETMNPSRRKETIGASRALPNAPPNANESFPRENLAILKLQWGKEKTEATFEQFSYPPSRFMSDIGGILALWIGLNVFSIFEFLEILYKFIKYKRAKR